MITAKELSEKIIKYDKVPVYVEKDGKLEAAKYYVIKIIQKDGHDLAVLVIK
jgi:hypothetical protein